MNFDIKANLAKKTIAYYLELAAAVLAIVGLIIFAVYVPKNGSGSVWAVLCGIVGILVAVAMFFTNDKISDLLGVVPPVMYMVAGLETLHTGVGNLVDSLQGIVMFGNKDLAGTNYLMTILFVIAAVVAIVVCFLPKEKKEQASAE